MTFKSSNQNQRFLLPPSYGDFLGESHEAVVLSEFMREIDTSRLEQSYHNQYGGRSAYHPEMLLTILVYAYMNGTFSSRKIAKRLRQDLAFMYLAGNTTPDFRTLSRFRKEKGLYLEDIFANIVRKAHELGLVSFGICSLDGTKIYANASREKNVDRDALQKKIRGFIAEAELIDAKEDALYGDEEDDGDPALKTKAGREKRKQELKEKQATEEAKLLKIEHAPNTRVNTTDPDSRLMRMKRKDFANGYNVQNIVENGIILSTSVFNTSADQGTLVPSVQKLQEVHRAPTILLADKGYSSEGNYSFCEQQNIDAYIPVHLDRVDLSRYTYNKSDDTYTDEAGHAYRFKQHMQKRPDAGPRTKTRDHSRYRTTLYEHVDMLTGKKSYLSVSSVWQEHIQKQKAKLSTPQGKLIYKKRMHDVEGVFANIKRNLSFTTFLLRGLAGVSTEWTLISMAHNMKKIL